MPCGNFVWRFWLMSRKRRKKRYDKQRAEPKSATRVDRKAERWTSPSVLVAIVGVVVSVLIAAGAMILNHPKSPPRYELRLMALNGRELEQVPGVVGSGVKVDFVLINGSDPQADMHNVAGQLWTETNHLVAAPGERRAPQNRRSADRTEYDINFPVFPKTASSHLPTFFYRLPEANERIPLGTQVVSAETDKQEYLWNVVNDGGHPRVVTVRSPDTSELTR
jgi:hypothetical protein